MFKTQQVIAERYQLQQKLGECSIRQTWLAQDLEADILVVIKLLAFGDRTQWNDIKLFEREAQILQQINHQFIPQYRNYFTLELPSTWFVLVEQYIPGRSLQLILEKGKIFSQAEVNGIAKKLLNILEYLHQFNPQVLHRDIKPSNIILGENKEIYLVDFGSIQNQMPAEGKSFTIVGTYGYTPLEQFGGRAVAASDLYALGVTLIHLLTGIPPAELPQKDLQIQLSDCLVRQKHRLKVTKHFATWLTKITHFSVERRFNNATQARRAIDFSFPELPFVARKGIEKSSKIRLILGLVALLAGTYTIQLLEEKNRTKLELNKIKYCQISKKASLKIADVYYLSNRKLRNKCGNKSDVVERLNKEKKSLAGYNLSQIHLNQVNLKEGNLERASLYRTYLIEADLQNANLNYAGINYANLEAADLEDASIKRNEERNGIKGTNFSRANLDNADFGIGIMSDVNFSFADLDYVYLGGEISDSNFERASLQSAYLQGKFINNNFQYADLSGVTLQGYLNSNIRYVSLVGADLQKAVFDSVDFYEVNLFRANLKGATIINSNPTAHQIKRACNWEQAYYINAELSQIAGNLESHKAANQQQNQQYIEQLKQDKASDPKEPVDCSKWD